MQTIFDFCLPTRSTTVPQTDDWLHEVNYDGYRLRLERDADRVRLITEAGTTGPTAIRGSSRRRAKSARSGLCWTARPWSSALTVSPISTPCIGASMMMRFNSARSIFSPMAVTICVAWPCRCAATAGAQAGGHLRQPVRVRRDRTRAVSGSVPDGAGRHRGQAAGSALSRRMIEALDQ